MVVGVSGMILGEFSNFGSFYRFNYLRVYGVLMSIVDLINFDFFLI